MNYAKKAGELLSKVRSTTPLLHHITNFVVMNDNANMALHIGASPVMAHAPNEMEEMASIAGVLVINIGTLSDEWVRSMEIAAETAGNRGIPIILDPVGAGASGIRTEVSLRLLEKYDISVLKGNLGEISVLAGLEGKVRGVDSISGADPVEAAKTAADIFGLPVAITGKEDVVSDGKRALVVSNGHRWLSTITGSGCSASTVVGAFLAIERQHTIATACALACYGVAAEIAAETHPKGPASFKTAFFDAVYNLTPEMVEKRAKIREV